ncbi:MAG TPA: VOC family protein [Pyrinomonadaceae bacterium]|nr:VOC family protein [Pyrinomonadaceae bacterium]
MSDESMTQAASEAVGAEGARLAGVVDHIAVKSTDIRADVEEYARLGFRVETLYDDWAMLRDARGFGVALLAPGSKHPPHMGLKVETREQLEEAARRENRPVKEHRDRSLSFYTRGVAGQALEVIYYPPDYAHGKEVTGDG